MAEVLLNGEMHRPLPMINRLRKSVEIVVAESRERVITWEERQAWKSADDPPALAYLREPESNLLRMPKVVGPVNISSIATVDPNSKYHPFDRFDNLEQEMQFA